MSWSSPKDDAKFRLERVELMLGAIIDHLGIDFDARNERKKMPTHCSEEKHTY